MVTVNEVALVAVPPGVVTARGPVVAAAGSVPWIAVAEVTVKLALTPLKVTAVAPVKFVPLASCSRENDDARSRTLAPTVTLSRKLMKEPVARR